MSCLETLIPKKGFEKNESHQFKKRIDAHCIPLSLLKTERTSRAKMAKARTKMIARKAVGSNSPKIGRPKRQQKKKSDDKKSDDDEDFVPSEEEEEQRLLSEDDGPQLDPIADPDKHIHCRSILGEKFATYDDAQDFLTNYTRETFQVRCIFIDSCMHCEFHTAFSSDLYRAIVVFGCETQQRLSQHCDCEEQVSTRRLA